MGVVTEIPGRRHDATTAGTLGRLHSKRGSLRWFKPPETHRQWCAGCPVFYPDLAGYRPPELPLPKAPSWLALNSDGGQSGQTSGTVLLAGHVVVRSAKGALWPLAATTTEMSAGLKCSDGTLAARTAARSAGIVPKGQFPWSLCGRGADRFVAAESFVRRWPC